MIKMLWYFSRVEDILAKLKDDINTKQTQIKEIADNTARVSVECKTMQEKLKKHENEGKKIDGSAKAKAADLEKWVSQPSLLSINIFISHKNPL